MEVADNGKLALERLADEPFDEVLMDEATRRLRELERAKGRVRSVVLALTANAMPRDRDASPSPSGSTSSKMC